VSYMFDSRRQAAQRVSGRIWLRTVKLYTKVSQDDQQRELLQAGGYENHEIFYSRFQYKTALACIIAYVDKANHLRVTLFGHNLAIARHHLH